MFKKKKSGKGDCEGERWSGVLEQNLVRMVAQAGTDED